MKPLLRPLVLAAALVIFTSLATVSAYAVNDTWNGAGTDWNTTANWNTAIPGTADTAIFSSTGNANLSVSLAATGSAKSITFTSGAGSYVISGSGTLSLANSGLVSTDDLIAGAQTISNAIVLGTGTVNATYAFTSNSSIVGNTLSFSGGISAGLTASALTLTLNGSNTGANTVSGVLSNGSSQLAVTKDGAGAWTLGANNTYTGATKLNAGTLILDYTTNTGNKLGSSGTSALTLGGVNLRLNGGSGIETVASTNANGGGQANISRSSGSEKIALGTLSSGFTSGTGNATIVNFQSGVASTTSTTNNSSNTATSILLSAGFMTVGSTPSSYDWAAVDGSGNIVGYSTVNSYIVLPSDSSSNANTSSNFVVDDTFGISGTGTTQQTRVNTLKIATTSTSTQTLTLGTGFTLGPNGGILNSAAGDYVINGAPIYLGASGSTINQWGAGTLRIDSDILGAAGIYWQKGGSGTLILGGNNAWKSAFTIQQGTVSVGSDANLGGASGNVIVASSDTASKTVTLSGTVPATLVAGSSLLGSTISTIVGNTVTLVANANQAIVSNTSMPYAIASGIVLNGGTLEASASFTLSETGATVQTRTVTLNSNGGTIQVDPAATLTAPGVVSGTGSLTKTGDGTLVLSAANTYTGGTNINAGTLALGSSGALGTSGTISFGGGALQHSANNTTDYSSRFSTAAGQSYQVDTNGQSVTWGTALVSSGGTLTKFGAGTLTLSAANTFTGATTVSAGTLALASAGSLASTSYVINTGATFDTSAKAAYSLAGVATTIGVGSANAGFFNAGSGTLTLGNSLTLNFTSSLPAASYDLYGSGSISGNFSSVTLTGLFSDSLALSGGIWTGNVGGYDFSLAQSTGILSVTASAVPEPADLALIMSAAAFGFLAWKKRRASPL